MNFIQLLKLIWKYLQPYRRVVWGCVFLAALASVISAVIPIVYGRLTDLATNPSVNLQLMGIVLVAWLVFSLLANWMGRIVDFQSSQMGFKCYRSFVADVYAHYLQLPVSFHKNKRSGEELSKINRAGDYLWGLIEQILFYLAPNFLTAILALILMFLTEWRMTLFLIIVLIVYVIASLVKVKPIILARKATNRFWEKVWGRIYDTVHNIQIVKSFVKEDFEANQTDENIDRLGQRLVQLFKTHRNLDAWQNTIQGLGFVAVFGIALYLLSLKQITIGVLVSFIGYVNLIFRPFNQLANNYRHFSEGLVTIGRAVKLFDIDKELYASGKKLSRVQGRIEFRNVSFAYGDKRRKVLRGISFIAQPGEVVALVGESGAGKTTLLSLISRYYSLNTGQILLDDQNIQNINLSFLRRQIAIVPQEVSLFNDLLKRNLLYAKPSASQSELIAALEAANAWEFVKEFPRKLNQKVGERGIKLSTGQKQRIAIAMAILRDPKILILDEATSALDSVSEELVQVALKKLIAGRTTFVIAHRLSTITHADNILVFNRGRLVEQGPHNLLVRNLAGTYYRLYQKQKF